MPLYVATNYNSLAAQNNLTANRVSLDTSLNRLSSGLRINTAADDAAGLAISTRLQNQINGLTQGGQNANSGISLANVADAALAQVVSNLQRIRTLAVQSQNSTNSATDRSALDAEVQQRLAEIQRIATQTSYNGLNLLDGSFSGAQFQVGANVGQTIVLSSAAQNVQTTSLGSFATVTGSVQYAAAAINNTTTAVNGVTGATGGTFTAGGVGSGASLTPAATAGGTSYQGVNATAISAGDIAINGTAILASAGYATSTTGQDASSAYAKAAAINASGVSGLTATATTSQTFDTTTGSAGNGNFVNATTIAAGQTANYFLSVNGTTVISQALSSTSQTITNATVAAAVNAVSSTTGVTATSNANGTITFNAADGRNVVLGEQISISTGTAAGTVKSAIGGLVQAAAGTAATSADTTTLRGQVSLTSASSINFTGPTSANITGELGLTTGTTTVAASSSLSAQNVTTLSNSNSTVYSVDSAIAVVNGYRATYGAVVNRLTSAVSAIGSQVQQLTTANGRITSADFAAETTNLSTTQIIQQAGTSILAQANSLPQGILKLLQ